MIEIGRKRFLFRLFRVRAYTLLAREPVQVASKELESAQNFSECRCMPVSIRDKLLTLTWPSNIQYVAKVFLPIRY